MCARGTAVETERERDEPRPSVTKRACDEDRDFHRCRHTLLRRKAQSGFTLDEARGIRAARAVSFCSRLGQARPGKMSMNTGTRVGLAALVVALLILLALIAGAV